MFKRKGLRNFAGIIAGATLFSTVSLSATELSLAHADNTSTKQVVPSEQQEINNLQNDNSDPSSNVLVTQQNLQDAKALLRQAGFTDNDFKQMSDKDIVYVYQQIKNPDPTTNLIGGTTVARGILKVWKKLPSSVKKTITRYTGLGGFLKLVDHYTGTEYNIIYSACRKAGMSKGTATFVTKTITLFI